MTDALFAIYYHCERPRLLGRTAAFDDRARATTGKARRTDEINVAAMIPSMSRALEDFDERCSSRFVSIRRFVIALLIRSQWPLPVRPAQIQLLARKVPGPVSTTDGHPGERKKQMIKALVDMLAERKDALRSLPGDRFSRAMQLMTGKAVLEYSMSETFVPLELEG